MGYVCVAPEHAARPGPHRSRLTAHDRAWAFCPAGESAGHVWSPIDRASFEDLTRAASSAARADLKA